MAATRQLGFRLSVIGSDKTVNELDLIKKKLVDVQKQIKSVQATKISLNTSFDTQGINDLLKVLGKVKETKLSPEIVATIKELKNQLKDLQTQVSKTEEQLSKVKAPEGLSDTEVKQTNIAFSQLNGAAKTAVETIAKLKPSIQNIDDKSVQQLYKSLSQVEIRIKEISKQRVQVLKSGDLTSDQKANLLAGLNEELDQLNIKKKEVKTSIKEVNTEFERMAKNIPKDSVVGLRLELNKLAKEYDLLSQAEREGARGQELKNKINSIHETVSLQEQSIGNFRRNVGNYQSAIQGLLPKLEELQREGLLAQKELGDIFKGDLIAREKALRAEIQKLGDEFKELGNDIARAGERASVLGQIDDRVRELASVRGTLDQTGNSLTRLGGKLASISDIVTGGLIGGGIIATLGALTGFAKGSVTEFTQAETALAKINQQLKVTNNNSGQTAEGLQEMAKELEVLTGIDGDQILNDITSGLLKFGNIQGQVFQDAQKAALDLSTVLDGDLKGATQLLGKALENPIKGITLLQKAGISLDASAQENIKQALKQNDIYKAQSIILGEVQGKFGGLATAVNNTDLQGLRKLTVDFNNFKEAVGKGLISAANTITRFFSDVALGVNVFDESTRTLERGLKTLEETAIREVSSIKGVTEALKDETLSREGRDALISELVTKYPDLIDQYDLEYASIERLNQIQQELTSTVLKQVGERIKAQTKEALLTEQINKSIEIAHLKAGRLTTGQNFVKGLSGQTQDQAIAKFTQEKEAEIKQLQSQINDVDKTFSEYDKTIAKALGLPVTNASFGDAEKLNTRIKAVIGETAKVLSDDKASKAAKDYALKLNAEFKGVQKELNTGDISEAKRSELIKKAAAGLTQLAALSGKRLSVTKESIEAEKKLNEDADKAIQEQQKRIEELKKKISDLDIAAIPNEFDKKIKEVKENTKRQVDEIQKNLDSLELKTIKTDADQIEIEKSNELISALRKTEDAAVTKIKEERTKTLKEATKELEDTRQEVLRIIGEINKTEIDIKISQTQFDLQQAEREIEIQFTSNVQDLEIALAQGTITEEEFSKRSQEIEAEKLDKIAELRANFEDEIKAGLQKQYEAEVSIMAQTLAARKQNIQDQLSLDLLQIDSDQREGKVDEVTATQFKLETNKKATKELEQLDKDYNANRLKLEQDLQSSIQGLSDKGVAAHEAAELAKTKIDERENLKRRDARKKDLEDAARIAKQEALNLAQSISDALFEIEAANNEKVFDAQRARIEKNYENQIKAAQGNSAEVERLEREKAQKIDEIDRQQSEKRKKAAIAKAIIDSSLAIIKAFAELGPIAGAVAAIFIGAQTAIQITKMKSQTFAKGAYFNSKGQGGFTGGSVAPPDETGERPIGTGVLHANEYIAPAKQTTKNDWLFNLLDSDRKRTNAGAVTDLETEIAKTIQKRRRVLFEIQTPSRRRFEPVIPIIIPFGGSGNNKIEFSDDQIERLADAISERVERGATRGTAAGTSEGIKQATKEALREDRTNLRKVI